MLSMRPPRLLATTRSASLARVCRTTSTGAPVVLGAGCVMARPGSGAPVGAGGTGNSGAAACGAGAPGGGACPGGGSSTHHTAIRATAAAMIAIWTGSLTHSSRQVEAAGPERATAQYARGRAAAAAPGAVAFDHQNGVLRAARMKTAGATKQRREAQLVAAHNVNHQSREEVTSPRPPLRSAASSASCGRGGRSCLAITTRSHDSSSS